MGQRPLWSQHERSRAEEDRPRRAAGRPAAAGSGIDWPASTFRRSTSCPTKVRPPIAVRLAAPAVHARDAARRVRRSVVPTTPSSSSAARSTNSTAQKEIEFPVAVGMTNFMAEGPGGGGERYNREGLIRWANDRFQVALPVGDVKNRPRNEIENLLKESSQQVLRQRRTDRQGRRVPRPGVSRSRKGFPERPRCAGRERWPQPDAERTVALGQEEYRPANSIRKSSSRSTTTRPASACCRPMTPLSPRVVPSRAGPDSGNSRHGVERPPVFHGPSSRPGSGWSATLNSIPRSSTSARVARRSCRCGTASTSR